MSPRCVADPDDFQIPRCLDTADEAIAVVRDLQAAWVAAPSRPC